jgi:putative transposase
LDATYLRVRDDHQVVSNAVVITTGVTVNGHREILGFGVGDSEDEAFWRAFLTSLRRRGLTGVRLVISDQHAGLAALVRRSMQGVAHQRCRLHFARSLMARIPKASQEMVAAFFRTVFAQPRGDLSPVRPEG